MNPKIRNYQSKIFVFTSAILMSLSAQATDVMSTFNTGDTLTAGHMTEISEAVNSKQNLVTGTCLTDQAIREINADGTVTCATVSLAAQSDSIYVSGADFLPEGGTDNSQWHIAATAMLGTFGFPKVDQETHVVAGIHLPNGATITTFACYYTDDEASFDWESLQFWLIKGQIGASQTDSVASIPSIQTLGASPEPAVAVADTIEVAVVDNLVSYYFVAVDAKATVGFSALATSNLRFNGCEIKFTR